MLKFDKIKMVAPLESTTNHDLSRFIVKTKQGEILYYKYQQTSPFSLIILYDIQHGESVLEFTSKVLRDDYAKMISLETIEQCLMNINKLGICWVDIEQFLQKSVVVKCDVTRDVVWDDFDVAKSVIKSNLSNYSKWQITPYSNHGIVISNTAKTRKKRLSIYKKNKELSTHGNMQFLESLENKEALLCYFDNIIRFELNIGNMKQIRTLLQIKDNNLMSVLKTDANPIADVFSEAVKTSSEIPTNLNLKLLEKWALIQYCHNDLAEVEAIVRKVVSKNTSVKQTMEPYRNLLNLNCSTGVHPSDIYNLIR